MKYLKLFENYVKTNLELSFYSVSYWENNSNVKTIYSGTDYEEAEVVFKSFDSGDLGNDIQGEYDRRNNIYYITLEISKKTNKYIWVGGEYDIEDFPLDDYYDDDSLYELMVENDFEIIDTKEVETPNSVDNRNEKELENNLKEEVISYIKSITSENKYAAFLNSTFYALKSYKDGYILLRVADHFFNIDNVNLGRDVLYDYIADLPQYNRYLNIYGFISINILNKDSKDTRGFRKDFKEWKEYNEETADLINYLDLDMNDYNSDWQEDLDSMLIEMETNIDDVLDKKIFETMNNTKHIKLFENYVNLKDLKPFLIDGKYLYHYTLTDNLDEILEYGLVPRKYPNSYYENGANGIFLTNKNSLYSANLPQTLMDVMDEYYEDETIYSEPPIVRLWIDVTKLDFTKFTFDDDYNLNRYSFNKAVNDTEKLIESLDIWGSVAYLDNIPKEYIIKNDFDYGS